MGVFDTMKKKAGGLADDAGRAGRVGAAQIKLRSLQGSAKEAVEKFGREALELIDKGELTHPDLEAAIARVREAEKAVADKEAEIEALRADADRPAPTEGSSV